MKFFIATLGCKVNTYESNVMMEELKEAGYQEGEEDCDVVIVNTCTVTNTSDRKSIKTIHQMVRNHPRAIIIVVGCLSQVEKDKISQIDGVNIVLGNIGKSHLLDYIRAYQVSKTQIVDVKPMDDVPFEAMCSKHFHRTRAFVKIQDGCNNFCSYCIIPYTRGNVRSKKKDEIIDEINHLLMDGHQEIVLTGIHTGHYGTEFESYRFSDLLEEILTKTKVKRLRISSIEMNEITDSVLELFQKYPVLVDHMHIPLQSGSDKILKLMNRKYLKEEFIEKIEQLRKIRPNMSITTDLIVGFPYEGELEFEETLETIHQIGFSKIHVFPYSRRKDTPADTMLQVSDLIKKERVRKILEVSKVLEQSYMERFLNQEVTFIPEVHRNGMLIGHTGNYLLIKMEGPKELLHQEVTTRLSEICYPYCIGTENVETTV